MFDSGFINSFEVNSIFFALLQYFSTVSVLVFLLCMDVISLLNLKYIFVYIYIYDILSFFIHCFYECLFHILSSKAL